MTNVTINAKNKSNFQKFGAFLSGMVIPNIGAFIAFGLITAIFIDSGWAPNAKIAELISPLLHYLLPILIGFSGGELVYGKRGGVCGAVATFGLIVGSDIAMFLGAMIIGPFGGFVIKKFDQLVDGKIPEGFEMIVNNFSLGILGGAICILSYLFIGPAVAGLTSVLSAGITWIIDRDMLPLSAIILEPARVLFLNNAIDHGIMAPLGLAQVAQQGYSPLFVLIPNPGVGLGVLLAYWLFGKGEMKKTAPGAIIIHFFGGIHEIFFPYVLANPLILIANIIGQAAGIITMQLTHYGTVYTPSPGSIISMIAMTPKGKYFGLFLAVLVPTVVTFLIASIFVKKYYKNYTEVDVIGDKPNINININSTVPIRKIVVACDAGMGSSAMSASSLKKRLKNEGLDVNVIHTSIQNIPDDADLVVTHIELAETAKKKMPDKNRISISSYMNPPEFDDIANMVKSSENKVIEAGKKEVLPLENIIITEDVKTKEDALKLISEKFVEGGYTTERYLKGMIAKEGEFHTNMGNSLAIPHGSFEYKENILQSGLVVIVNKNGIMWNDELCKLIIGIAGKGDEHLEILAKIAEEFDTEEKVNEMVELADAKAIKEKLLSK